MAAFAELALRMAPSVDDVPDLLDRIEVFAEAAQLPPGVASRLALLCEELVVNVALYGTGATFVSVAVERQPGALQLTIVDDGPAFDPLAQAGADTASGLEEREIGGLGIHFVRSLVRSLAYARQDGCNRTTAVLDAT
jgi:serine/threonine-protein kinase RsbW